MSQIEPKGPLGTALAVLLGTALIVWFTVMSIHYASAEGAEWDVDAMNKTIDDTSVVVNKNCSGTLIGVDLVLTANHCVMGTYTDVERDVIGDDGEVKKKKFRVYEPGSVSKQQFEGTKQVALTSWNYSVKGQDLTLDLALLKTTVKVGSNPSVVACKGLRRGETIYAVGNPFVVLTNTVSKGIVSNTQRNYQDLDIVNGQSSYGQDNGMFQFTAAISPGNSGGALYSATGEIVGVTVRGARTGNIGLGVPLEDVRKFLKRLDVFATKEVGHFNCE